MPARNKKKFDKVAAALVKDPLATEKEIAKKTKVPKSTVHDIKKDVRVYSGKDERIHALTGTDFSIVQLGTKETERRLKSKTEIRNMSLRDLTDCIEKAAKRYMLFRGDVTDDHGGLKEIEDSTKELYALISVQLKNENT